MAKKIPVPSSERRAWLTTPWPVVILLVLHVGLGLSAVRQQSMTFDEGAHFAGGYSYWAANDYRMHPENGNWSQRWAGLPLWLSNIRNPLVGRGWQIADVWGICDRLFYESGADADTLVARGRMMMAVPSALLGLLIYLWARRLFGAYGGLVSLTVFAFSPTMLANGFLAASDLFATLFFLAAIGALWALVHRVSIATVLWSCFTVAGLMLSKHSGVLIAPMALVLVAVRMFNTQPLEWRIGSRNEVPGRGRQLGIFAALAAVITLAVVLQVWMSYGFRYAAFAPGREDGATFLVPWQEIQKGWKSGLNRVVQVARDNHLLPEGYLHGLSITMLYAQHRSAFLNGEFSVHGWVSFFPYCLAVKTPLAVFVLLGLAGWAYWVYRDRAQPTRQPPAESRRPPLYELTPLLILFVVYWLVALNSRLNIGHRHIMPTYPPLFIFAGAAALWLKAPRALRESRSTTDKKSTGPSARQASAALVGRVVLAVALLAGATESVLMWPNYLAYFNILAGGPRNGYRHLVDSSLDWGQGLKALKTWLDNHPEESHDPSRVYLSYFGTARPEYYGIHARHLLFFFPRPSRPFIPQPLTGGLYCVTASMLSGVYTAPLAGRWNEQFENEYQRLRPSILQIQALAKDPETHRADIEKAATPEAQEMFRAYEILRFSRLTSYLRHREPDDQVGYSILIYRLTDADIASALEGLPLELLPEPELKNEP